MTIATMLSLGETALKLGLICSLTVLALFLSYSMLNVCDLSTDGCFTFGAAVGAVVAVSGHPFLSVIAAMLAGVLSGFVTAILQTKLGVDSSACRNYRKYSLVFREYCSDGRIFSHQYESDSDCIFHDEGGTFRHTTEGKRGYHCCTDRSDPCRCISGIFPQNKAWPCNPGNGK